MESFQKKVQIDIRFIVIGTTENEPTNRQPFLLIYLEGCFVYWDMNIVFAVVGVWYVVCKSILFSYL